MYDIRLLSARARIIFAGFFASTLSVGAAILTLVALGITAIGVTVALVSGVVIGAAASRILAHWKLAPLNERMRARQRSLIPRGEAGRFGLIAERASVDRHLDALLSQLDFVASDRVELQQQTQQLQAALQEAAEAHAALETALRDELLDAATSLEQIRLQLRLVSAAIRSETATEERLLKTMAVGARDGHGPCEEVVMLASEALERARRIAVLGAVTGQASMGGARSDTDSTTRRPFETVLAGLARSAAFRLECDVLVHLGGRAPAYSARSEEVLLIGLNLVLDHLARQAPAQTPLCVDVAFEPSERGADAVMRIHTSIAVALSAPDPDSDGADLPLALAQWLDGRRDGSALHASGDVFILRLPADPLRRDIDSNLNHVNALNRRSVLVIDPFAPRREVLCALLSPRQILPTAVSTVSEAIDRLAEAGRAKKNFDFAIVVPDATETNAIGDIWSTTSLDELLSRPEIPSDLTIIAMTHVSALTGLLHGDTQRQRARVVTRPTSTAALLDAFAATTTQTPRQPQVGRNRDSQTHVLIAEDNAVTQLHLSRLLEQRGITTTVVGNGAEAVDRFLSDGPGAYAAILMDIQMPVMDGHEATQVIRAREARDGLVRLPIIAVTAHAMATERQRCLQAGMNEHLTKPVDAEQLFTMLGRLVGRHFLAPPIPEPPSKVSEIKPETVPSPTLVPPPTAPVRRFDREHLLEFAGGDASFVQKLSDIFNRTAPRQATELADAFAAGDLDKTRFIAHQLKGAVGNFGADSAHKLAADIELHARAGTTDGLEATIDALRGDIDWICDELKRLSASLS